MTLENEPTNQWDEKRTTILMYALQMILRMGKQTSRMKNKLLSKCMYTLHMIHRKSEKIKQTSWMKNELGTF